MKKTLSHLLLSIVFSAVLVPSFAMTIAPPASDESSVPTRDSAASLTREQFDKAMMEFKSLSRHDRKQRVSEAKKTLKQYKADKRAGKAEPSTNTVLLVILAILLPPLAVYLHEGTINGKFWLSILLTLLFWIPGVIYALIVVLS
ncbi:MAG TPA: YqaE/Pmp3 family membrane protein [Parafilimonas sp.]|nr:YqaE/Pmp3 family membrane protein [Parafilimonas sp.]